ncbi:hypothetical protein D3C81_24400 [compost metagenome]
MIRKQAIYCFASEYSEANRDLISHDVIEQIFPVLYFGHVFNELFQKASGTINLTTNRQTFRFQKFEASFNIDEIMNRGAEFRVKAVIDASAMKDGDVPPDFQARPINTAEVEFRFHQSPKKVPKEGEEVDRRAFESARQHRAMRNLREEISQADHSLLEHLVLMASTAVIELFKEDEAERPRKELDKYCFDLHNSNRIQAATKVINSNYAGEKGEDVLIQNLMSGRTVGEFSCRYGTAGEWHAIHTAKRQDNRNEPLKYTTEEEDAFNAIGLTLNQYFKDKSE